MTRDDDKSASDAPRRPSNVKLAWMLLAVAFSFYAAFFVVMSR